MGVDIFPDEIGPETQHAAFHEVAWAATSASGLKGTMLRDLFKLYCVDPAGWVHWTAIRDQTYRRLQGQAGVTSDKVNKLGRKLKAYLEGKESSNWKITLERKKLPPDKSFHWRLVIEQEDVKKIPEGVISPSSAVLPLSKPFAPEFVWQSKDFISRLPIWLPIDTNPPLDFIINVVSDWIVPPQFADYLAFKAKRWKKKQKANEDDSVICSYRNIRNLKSLGTRTSSIGIDVAVARYSDYVATNEQVIEWISKEGESRRVQEFKRKCGPHLEMSHFPSNAANPLIVFVNLITADGKCILSCGSTANEWSSPAAGLIEPFIDFHRSGPFFPSPNETVIRLISNNLGIPIHSNSVCWSALGLNRETGIVALLGEMTLDLEVTEVESLFKLTKGSLNPQLKFVNLDPESIVSFLGAVEPFRFLEVSLALSLSSRFDSVKISVSSS